MTSAEIAGLREFISGELQKVHDRRLQELESAFGGSRARPN